MKCKACNADLTDREMRAKDENDEYLDLCSQCLPVSREAVEDAAASTDWGDDGLEVLVDERSDDDYWCDFIAMHAGNGLYDDWQDGVGLMSAVERVCHMEAKAYDDFLALLALGYARPYAAEKAINAPWVLTADVEVW